jgi:hypothetical protein
MDAAGRIVRHLDGPGTTGVDRVVWDLTTDPPGWPHAAQDPRPYYVFYPLAIAGPQVLPGSLRIRLRARGVTLTVPLVVRLDPASNATTASLQAQYDALAFLAKDQERAEVWLANKKLARYANQLRNGNGSENAGYQQPAQVMDQIGYLRHIIETSDLGPTKAQRDLMQVYHAQLDRIARSIASPHP